LVTTIRITGLKEVEDMIIKLPSKIESGIYNEGKQFMNDMLKNMKMMAPVATGFLKDQLNMTIQGKTITIDTGEAYYAVAQEFGFPAHIIPMAYLDQHYEFPNLPGMFTKNTGGFVNVKKNTPFMMPAFEMALTQLNSRLGRALTTVFHNK
jgi:hypothetical protein